MADEPIQVVDQPTINNGGGRVDDPNESVRKERDALVSEIKTLRQDKADLASRGESTADVDKKIADALLKKEKDDADKTWGKTFEGFLQKHKDFHPDNDAGGLKKAALERELKGLNRAGLTTSEEFEIVLEKARILATSPHVPSTIQVRVDPSLPRDNPSPRSSDENKLEPKEQRLIEQLGWTAERYLKLKLKDPAFVANALRQVS